MLKPFQWIDMIKVKKIFVCGGLFAALMLFSACGTSRETTGGDSETYNLGYAKISKRSSTNGIGAWRREQSTDNPALTLADMLLRIPGVQVSGRGDNARVTIRGINSFYSETEPLFVVDGVSVGFGLRSVSFLNPMEVDNISVLKDSAAAIYGVRGANGVVIIESKRPGDLR